MFWQIFQHMQFVHDYSSSPIPRIRKCFIRTPLPISRDLHQWKFSSFMYFIRQTKNRRALKTLEFLLTAHRATLWCTLKHESILNYLFHWFTFFVLVQMSSAFLTYLFTHLCISFSWCMSLAKLPKSDRCKKKIWLRDSKPRMWQHTQWLVSLPRSCRHKKWWPHVHRCSVVIQPFLSGWVVVILLWLRVKSLETSALIGLPVVKNHSSFK